MKGRKAFILDFISSSLGSEVHSTDSRPSPTFVPCSERLGCSTLLSDFQLWQPFLQILRFRESSVKQIQRKTLCCLLPGVTPHSRCVLPQNPKSLCALPCLRCSLVGWNPLRSCTIRSVSVPRPSILPWLSFPEFILHGVNFLPLLQCCL